uniref:Solute carrier organic anion transporter family member n=1 Tax=Parascaris univalens TaxID=6257 RepID=A0A914ZJI2_PARUN
MNTNTKKEQNARKAIFEATRHSGLWINKIPKEDRSASTTISKRNIRCVSDRGRNAIPNIHSEKLRTASEALSTTASNWMPKKTDEKIRRH